MAVCVLGEVLTLLAVTVGVDGRAAAMQTDRLLEMPCGAGRVPGDPVWDEDRGQCHGGRSSESDERGAVDYHSSHLDVYSALVARYVFANQV